MLKMLAYPFSKNSITLELTLISPKTIFKKTAKIQAIISKICTFGSLRIVTTTIPMSSTVIAPQSSIDIYRRDEYSKINIFKSNKSFFKNTYFAIIYIMINDYYVIC